MRPIVFAGRAWRNLNRRISRLYMRIKLCESSVELVRYGSGEGSWMAPAPDAFPEGAVVYCGGVGLDASFDFDVRKRTGTEVHSFDPTPKAINYMERANDCGVIFHPWGMAAEDCVLRFYMPLKESQNLFVTDLHQTGRYIEAQCYRLGTIMERLDHEKLFLMKIDIEGSWYNFTQDFLAQGIVPEVFNIEFDSPAPLWRVREIARRLAMAGLFPVFREKDNVTFVRKADGQPGARSPIEEVA